MEGHHKVNRWDNTELNRLDNTELIDWGLAFLCFLWTVSYLFVYFFQNHARAIGWLQKAVNSCLSLEAHTQNKETIPYAQPGDGNLRPCLVLGQLHSRAQMPHATTRLSSWPTNTHVSVWRELRWGLSPGSPCCGPESSSQPAVTASHRTFSSMVITTTSVRAVQDGSCLGASKKNSQGKKSDLETNRFVISCHAIWFSGKLPALSVAKKSRQILRVPPSRGAEQGAIRCHTRRKAAQRKGVTHPCTVVEETEHTAREIKQSQNNHFCCDKFIFQCSPLLNSARLGWPGLAHSRAPGLPQLPASCQPSPCTSPGSCRPWPQKGHETRRGETLAETTAVLSAATRSQIPAGCCTALISRHKFKVSLDALTENWHCPRPAVSTTSNKASQLLAVILFIIAGLWDKQKRSPVVLSAVQESLISLLGGCPLQLFFFFFKQDLFEHK